MALEIDDYLVQSTKGNNLERGGPTQWDWKRDGGHYFNSRDFLSVHWEVHLPNFPNIVRLHVESPRFEANETLNKIKADIIKALLDAPLERLAARAGLKSELGSRIKPDDIKNNKCTEVFRVILTPKQFSATHRVNIELVHAVLSDRIDEILQTFKPQLWKEFKTR